jgi:hypothetical protein
MCSFDICGLGKNEYVAMNECSSCLLQREPVKIMWTSTVLA